MPTDRERLEESSRRVDGLSDMLKGAISSGVRSVFLTEEGVRNIIGELLPKEIGTYVKAQIDAIKKEAYQAFVSEFKSFLSDLDVGEEGRKMLTGLKMRVNLEIEFVEQPEQPSKPPKKKK